MKYAVIQLGGKQFKVSEGVTLKIERQKSLDLEVLLYVNGDEVIVGKPFISEVKVTANSLGEERGKKVTVARFKSKSRYHKKKGHRQPLSVIEISSIGKVGDKPKKTSVVKESKKKSDSKQTATKQKTKPTTKKEEIAKAKTKRGRPKKEVKSEEKPKAKRGRPKKVKKED